MNRQEWGEVVGDNGSVMKDLEWTLFQAERSVSTMRREAEESDKERDWEVFEINLRNARDARLALIPLYQRGGGG